jgi:hypothetical protein
MVFLSTFTRSAEILGFYRAGREEHQVYNSFIRDPLWLMFWMRIEAALCNTIS